MKRLHATALLAGLLVMGALMWRTAEAGRHDVGHTVNIDPGSRIASGAVGEVRNSASPIESISCSVGWHWPNGNWVNCSAYDASGKVATCSTTASPELVSTLASLNGDSHLAFWWNDINQCTQVYVTNGSQLTPK